MVVQSLLVMLILACTSAAGEPSTYEGRTIAHPMSWMGADWLHRSTRQAEEDAAALLSFMDLRPGVTVCDVGVGSGYHALPMAKQVAPSTVYGVDIQPEMLQMLGHAARDSGLSNITAVLGTETDTRLPAGSCDRVLLVDAYHEFSHPTEMLASIRNALSPQGKIYVVEFRAEDPTVPIKPEHKMTKRQVVRELGKDTHRLTLVDQLDTLPIQHVLVFARDDSGLDPVEPTRWKRPR